MHKVGTFLGATGMILGGTFCTLLGGYILIQIPSSYQAETNFKSKSILGSGTVIKVKTTEHWVQSGYSSYPVTDLEAIVKFQPNQGKAVEFTDRSACDDHLLTSVESDIQACLGKTVPVLYTPENPDNARATTKVNPANVIIWELLAGSLLLIGGTAVLAETFKIAKSSISEHYK